MLNPKNFGLAGGLVFGALIFLVTLVSVANGYGSAFLNIISSIYPGYSISYLGSMIGFVYGFLDAFIMFYIFAWLYNWLEKDNYNSGFFKKNKPRKKR